MNEDRTRKCLRQVKHICGHLWHRYSITVNQIMVATVKFSKWWLQLYQKVASLLAATLYQGNPDRNHKLWNIVSSERERYSICRCCWNVATYKWKVHNGKIKIISFVVKINLWYNKWLVIYIKRDWRQLHNNLYIDKEHSLMIILY